MHYSPWEIFPILQKWWVHLIHIGYIFSERLMPNLRERIFDLRSREFNASLVVVIYDSVMGGYVSEAQAAYGAYFKLFLYRLCVKTIFRLHVNRVAVMPSMSIYPLCRFRTGTGSPSKPVYRMMDCKLQSRQVWNTVLIKLQLCSKLVAIVENFHILILGFHWKSTLEYFQKNPAYPTGHCFISGPLMYP